MLKLKEFRTTIRGLPDLLNYAALVEDGIILNKDGSFLCAFYFRGQDLDSSTALELSAMSAQINAALVKLGTGWMINVDSIRQESVSYTPREKCFFPDPVTSMIDEERRQQHYLEGSHFENIYALTFTYQPPPDMRQKITAVFIDDDTENGGRPTKQNYENFLERFSASVKEMHGLLSSNLLLTFMHSDELLTFLHSTITGLYDPVKMPSIPMYLDKVLATKDFRGGMSPKIGAKHVRIISVFGFPSDSVPGVLDVLNHLPIQYRWSTRFIPLDIEDAEKILKVYRRNWFQKRSGLMGLVKSAMGGASQTWANTDAVRMANDADNAANEATEGAVRYGFYTTVIIVMHDDSVIADENAKKISKAVSQNGFPTNIEDMNAVDAYLGSIPGHGYPNVRRPLIHTLNLADLMPLTAVWAGANRNPCPFYPPDSPPLMFTATTGATPFRVSLHVSDTGHTLIIGPTGSGKSVLLALIQAQHFRYPDAQVFLFDKGYSAYVLVNASGGEHYDIAGEDSGLSFCPLASIDSEADRSWAKEYIETLITIQFKAGEVITPSQRDAIHVAVERLAQNTTQSHERTLTNLRNTIQDQTLRDALAYYTISGTLGSLLDAENDSLRTHRFQVFEMEHLMGRGEKAVIPVLLYLFRQIEKRLNGEPTLIVLDEAWLMLSHPVFREKIREWLKVLRKMNAAFVFATQSLSDVLNSAICDVIFESTATKILLPNPEAKSQQFSSLYQKIGLNDRQIDIIAGAVRKRQYYLMSSEGRRLFDLGLGPVALAFVGASSKEQLGLAKKLMTQDKETWVYNWLLANGVSPDWANYWIETKIGAWQIEPNHK